MTVPIYLRGRNGAFLALGVTALSFLLLIVAPVVAVFIEQWEDIQTSKRQIESAQAQLTRMPGLQQQYATLKDTAATTPGLLTAGSAALGQAQLQSEMASLIASHGGIMSSAQILAPTKVHGFDEVAIRYDLTLPLSQLPNLLFAVETHAPYFFIDDADLVMQNEWSSDLVFMPDPVIQIRWVVRAYRWSGRP